MSTKNFASYGDMETLMTGIKSAIDGAGGGGTSKISAVSKGIFLIPKKWNNSYSYDLMGNHVWTDGENIYQSLEGGSSRILDKSTGTWSRFDWGGHNNFYGGSVVNINGDFFHCYKHIAYKLDKSTNTWSEYTFQNAPANFETTNIWFDGTYYYYLAGTVKLRLNTSTTPYSWVSDTNAGPSANYCYGNMVFNDGTDILLWDGGNGYKYNPSTRQWSSVTFEQGISSYGVNNVCTYKNIIFCSINSTTYIYNKYPKRFDATAFNVTLRSSAYIWSDGEHLYYSGSGENYEFSELSPNATCKT